jgi:DNA-binding transcriptional regulator LsrR (DeoR family)
MVPLPITRPPRQQKNDEPYAITQTEAGRRLGISRTSVSRLLREGRLVGVTYREAHMVQTESVERLKRQATER